MILHFVSISNLVPDFEYVILFLPIYAAIMKILWLYDAVLYLHLKDSKQFKE